MKNTPDKIYLQIGDDCPDDVDFKELHKISWCTEKINENDIEYIATSKSAEDNKALMEEIAELKHLIKTAYTDIAFEKMYEEIATQNAQTLTQLADAKKEADVLKTQLAISQSDFNKHFPMKIKILESKITEAESSLQSQEAINKQLIEALDKVKEYQMNYVQLARTTELYKIADEALSLKDNKQK